MDKEIKNIFPFFIIQGVRMEYLEILKDTFLTDERYMYIVNGVIFSIGITLFSAILGIILGLLLAVMKLSHLYPFKRIKAL